MVRVVCHLRQRKAFTCDDPEWPLDFAWRGIPGRFAVAPLVGGSAKSEGRIFRAPRPRRVLGARNRTRALRSTPPASLCYLIILYVGFTDHSWCILTSCTAKLFRVV